MATFGIKFPNTVVLLFLSNKKIFLNCRPGLVAISTVLWRKSTLPLLTTGLQPSANTNVVPSAADQVCCYSISLKTNSQYLCTLSCAHTYESICGNVPVLCPSLIGRGNYVFMTGLPY